MATHHISSILASVLTNITFACAELSKLWEYASFLRYQTLMLLAVLPCGVIGVGVAYTKCVRFDWFTLPGIGCVASACECPPLTSRCRLDSS